MSKLRRIKRILTNKQLPHYYGEVRKMKRRMRLVRRSKQRNKT